MRNNDIKSKINQYLNLCSVAACVAGIQMIPHSVYASAQTPSVAVQYRATTGKKGLEDQNMVLQGSLPLHWISSAQTKFFLDTRIKKSYDWFDELNLGLAMRHRVGEDAWFGAYVFSDYMKVVDSKGTPYSQGLGQWTLGLESLHKHHVGRMNVYIPWDRTLWNPKAQTALNFERRSLQTTQYGIRASRGLDFEWGPRWQTEQYALHVFGGGAAFESANGFDKSVRAGVSLITKPQGAMPQFEVYARLNKSIDKNAQGKKPLTLHTGIAMRFYPAGKPRRPLDVSHTPIERDVNIVTHQVARSHETPLNMGSGTRIVDSHGKLQVKGNAIVGKDGKTVPLKGISHFWINEHWGGEAFCTEETVNEMVKLGVDVFRVPVGVEEGRTGILDYPEQVRKRMDTVVDAAIKHGKYVIIDWHSHKAQDYTQESIAFFEEMAERYKDVPNVIFEIYNEPVGGTQWHEIKNYSQQVTSAIRAKGADNLIIVGTPTWSQDVDQVAKDRIEDHNAAYALHFYAGTHQQGLRDKAQSALNDGLPLFISECGGVQAWGGGDFDHADWKKWMNLVDQYNIPTVFWHMGNTQKYETSSAIFQETSPTGPWLPEHMTGSGQAFLDTIQSTK